MEGEKYYVARERETVEDLFRGEAVEPAAWYHA